MSLQLIRATDIVPYLTRMVGTGELGSKKVPLTWRWNLSPDHCCDQEVSTEPLSFSCTNGDYDCCF